MREALVNLHPTLIIPPIPEKHSMADYAAKPTKAKEDQGIIELRQRMLATFLNRCRKMKEVREDGVWWRFLDPNASWVGSFSFRHVIVSICRLPIGESLLVFLAFLCRSLVDVPNCGILTPKRLRYYTHIQLHRFQRTTSKRLPSTRPTPHQATTTSQCPLRPPNFVQAV